MSERNKKYAIVFVLTAIFTITTPIALLLIFGSDVSNAFLTFLTDDDSVYWVVGTIALLALLGLLCSYMIFNLIKDNITTYSKIWALIMLPLLATGSTIGFTFHATSIAPEVRGPYLSWMSDPTTTMTVTFEIKGVGDYEVNYGTSQGSMESKISFTRTGPRAYDGYYHYTASITGLSPGTKYYYKIPGFSDLPISFKTAPNNQTAKFKFLLYGDSRVDNILFGNAHTPLINQLLASAHGSDLAFAINTGDTAREHHDANLWNIHFTAIRNLAKSIPYFVASGNHEWNENEPNNLAAQPALDIQDFPMVNDVGANVYSLDEVSFSFAFANSFFIFLGYPHAGHESAEYSSWLDQQLAIGKSNYDFTFVSLHRPPFDDRTDGSDDNSDIIKYEGPKFHSGGVDAVFAGHNHVLAHQNITWDGDPTNRNVTYVIAGGGGASLRVPQYGTWDNTYDAGFRGKTVYCKGTFHYYVVEVDGAAGTATFTAYELGGAVLEAFTIQTYDK